MAARFGDHLYTADQRRKIEENRIVEKLEELQRQLTSIGYTVSEPDLKVPQDPTIWISGFSAAIVAQVKMQLTGRKVVINFRANSTKPLSPGPDAKDRLKRALLGSGFLPKIDGAYAPLADFKTKNGFPGGIDREDVEAIHTLLSWAIAKLQGSYSPVGSGV